MPMNMVAVPLEMFDISSNWRHFIQNLIEWGVYPSLESSSKVVFQK